MPDTELLGRIDNFLGATGMKPTTFGKQAIGDQNLVFALRGGRDLRTSTRERVLKFIADYRERVIQSTAA